MSNPSIADDVAARGASIFESQIRGQIKGLDPEAFLAIDVDSGDFEISEDDIQVFDILKGTPPERRDFSTACRE